MRMNDCNYLCSNMANIVRKHRMHRQNETLLPLKFAQRVRSPRYDVFSYKESRYPIWY